MHLEVLRVDGHPALNGQGVELSEGAAAVAPLADGAAAEEEDDRDDAAAAAAMAASSAAAELAEVLDRLGPALSTLKMAFERHASAADGGGGGVQLAVSDVPKAMWDLGSTEEPGSILRALARRLAARGAVAAGSSAGDAVTLAEFVSFYAGLTGLDGEGEAGAVWVEVVKATRWVPIGGTTVARLETVFEEVSGGHELPLAPCLHPCACR